MCRSHREGKAQAMEWTDEGIVLSTRAYGESSAVAEVFTLDHGRHLGLIKGARSRRLASVTQTANLVGLSWRARLAEHLGMFRVELLAPYAAQALDDPLALAGASSLCALSRLLPERVPHPALYRALKQLLSRLDEPGIWPALVAPWELMLLAELGFALDLESCAATGVREDLAYVSPKSGQAVSAQAGEPYKDRLLRLPAYLLGRRAGEAAAPLTAQDLADALALTAYFLEKRVLAPSGASLPQARLRLSESLARAPF
jgi:DNA repair protein RecO (recombination protein O)